MCVPVFISVQRRHVGQMKSRFIVQLPGVFCMLNSTFQRGNKYNVAKPHAKILLAPMKQLQLLVGQHFLNEY